MRSPAWSRVPRLTLVSLLLWLPLLPPATLASPSPTAEAAPAAQDPPFHLMEATISQIHRAMRSGQLTCHQLVQGYLDRIAAYDQQGPALDAIQTVNPDALAEADQLDAAYRASGPVGPLHCIPVLVKDEVQTDDMPTTYGSALFQNFVPDQDATIVDKMKAAGAIILAKTNMGEWAAGYAGTAFGFCRNAYDPTRNPSGSSCGTGVGLAANFGTVGIGEDTAGSIRGPAAFSNLVGLRPTLPLVSRYGLMPSNPTRDTLGPMARTVRDAAILLDTIAGYDPNDPVTAASVGNIPSTYTSFLKPGGLAGMRIGVIRQTLAPDTDPTAPDYQEVHAVFDQALADLQAHGATVVDTPDVGLGDMVRSITTNYEGDAAAKQYFAQLTDPPAHTLLDLVMSDEVIPSRRTGLAAELGHTTSDPGYLQELLTREQLREAVLKLMADQQLDALVYPTFDHVPTLIPDDIMTRTTLPSQPGSNRNLAPLLGYPALSVPGGFTPEGLPVGIEFLGRPFAEGTLLQIGYGYERAVPHRVPPASTPPLPGEM